MYTFMEGTFHLNIHDMYVGRILVLLNKVRINAL
jgi:hypothetical protein